MARLKLRCNKRSPKAPITQRQQDSQCKTARQSAEWYTIFQSDWKRNPIAQRLSGSQCKVTAFRDHINRAARCLQNNRLVSCRESVTLHV